MVKKKDFVPLHINATSADFAGNNGLGPYILLPGSDGRAKQIAKHFDNLQIKTHSRGHHLYFGTIKHKSKKIEVATVATGMGCPSMEIIMHELFQLGGRRFLRVGTAGSLQSNVKPGDFINVQAAVRDEQTTLDYCPAEVPAVASLECLIANLVAAKKIKLTEKLHTGIVHCKSSLYAREFGKGPRAKRNMAYLNLLTRCGVLASEMETAALFIQAQIYNYELVRLNKGKVLAGAILAIITKPPNIFLNPDQGKKVTADLIIWALESVKVLYESENLKA